MRHSNSKPNARAGHAAVTKRFLAVAVYACVVGDEFVGTLDYQVRLIEAPNEREVRLQLANEESHQHTNCYDQVVTWRLRRVMSVSPFSGFHYNRDLTRFTTNAADFAVLGRAPAARVRAGNDGSDGPLND